MLKIPPPGTARNRGRLFPVSDFQLPIGVLSAGIENRCREPYRWHGLQRGNLEILLFQYTLQGMGKLRFEDTTRSVYPGQSMLLLIPHDHCYWLPKSGNWCFLYLCLAGRETMRLGREIQEKTGPLWETGESADTFNLASAICEEILHNPDLSRWDLSRMGYEFLLHLCRIAAGDTPSGPPRPGSSPPAPLARAIRYMESRFHEPIGVDALAEAAGLSRYHFSRLFRKHIGQPPGARLRQIRLEHAMQLLQNTRLTIHEVARRSGFTDPDYFSRLFHQTYGVPPSHWRSLF